MPVVAAVAGLDGVAIALMAALLALALTITLRPILVGGLSLIPGIGGFVASHADAIIGATIGLAMSAADQAAGPLADLLHRLLAVQDTLTRYLVGTLDNVFNSLWRLHAQELPALETRAETYAQQLAQAAIQHADQVAGQAEAYAQQLEQVAIQHADQVGQEAVAYAGAGIAAAERYADQLAQAAIAHADQVGIDAIAHADEAAQAAEGYAGQLAQQTLEYVGAALHDLGLELEQVGQADQSYARQIGQAAEGYAGAAAAGVGAAAAAATAAVAARVQAIEDSPCQQYCSPLGELGQLLGELGDDVFLAAVLALFAEARAHPREVADEFAALVTPIARDAARALQLGIPG